MVNFRKQKKKKLKFDEKNIRTEEAFIIPDEDAFVEFVVVPPDGGWGWVVVCAAFVAGVIIDGIMFCAGLFLVEISEDLKVTPKYIIVANSIANAVYFLAGPFICACANRFGFRVVAICGGLLGAISLLSTSFLPEIVSFILFQGFITGAAFGMSYIGNILAVGFYFDKWRPVAIAVAVTGSGVGILTLPLIMNMLLKGISWRLKYRYLAGALFFVALLGIVLKPIAPVILNAPTLPGLEEETSGMSLSLNEDNPKSIFYRKNFNYPTNMDMSKRSSYSVYVPTSKYMERRTSRSSFKSYSTYNPRYSLMSFRSTAPERKKCSCCTCCACCDLWKCRINCLKCKAVCPTCVNKREMLQRPMYKDDIMYTGSIYTLSPFDKNTPNRDVVSLDFHMSVTRISTPKDIEENQECCICCPESTKRTLATMFNLSLMRSPSFVLLVLSGFLTYVGVFVPYVYIIDYGIACGHSKTDATSFLSVLGAANTVGRLVTGLIALSPNAKALLISEICLILGGIAVFIIGFTANKIAIYILISTFGFTISCLSSLRPIIAVEMVGLPNLTNAIGLIVFFEGVASLFGLPLADTLKEITGSYFVCYIYGGVMIVASGLILLPIPIIVKREKRKIEEHERQERERMQKYTQQKLQEANKPTTSKKLVK